MPTLFRVCWRRLTSRRWGDIKKATKNTIDSKKEQREMPRQDFCASISTGTKKTMKRYNTKPLEKYLLGAHYQKDALDAKEGSQKYWPSEYKNPKRKIP